MGTRIRIRRSSVPSNRPSLSQLQTGELALNTYDGRLFAIRDEQTALGIGSTVTLLTPWTENIGGGIYYADSNVGIGTTVPTSTLHVVGNSTFDNNLDIGGNLKVSGTSDFIGIVTFRGGTLNLGDSDSDDIFVGGEFSSGLNPTSNLALDLGTPTKQWAELHAGSVILSGISTFNQTVDFNHSVKIVGVVTFQDDIYLGNDDRIHLGGSDDLQIYNDGFNSYIVDAGVGDLFIRGTGAIRLQNAEGTENYAIFNDTGSSELFYDNKKHLTTTEQGVGIAGSITVDNDLLVTGVSTFASNVDLNSDLDVDGKTDLDDLSVSGVSTFAKFVDIESNLNVDGTAEIDDLNVSGITTTNILLFNNYLKGGNNDKIYLGNDNDLIIYHTGSQGYIDNNKSHLYIRNNVDNDDGGNIYIQAKSGENSIICFDDSSVYLYYNGVSRLNTYSGGVVVTGELDADSLDISGGAEVDGRFVLRDSLYIQDNLQVIGISTFGNYTFRGDVIEGPAELIIDPAGIGDNTGLVRIKGDLYVDGEQFVVSSSTIELADHVVGIASTTSSDLLTDGAGIGIGGTSIRKTFTYNQSSDSLKSSEHLDVALNKTYKINGTEVLRAGQLTIGNAVVTGVSTLTTVNGTNLTYSTADIDTAYVTTGIVTTLQGTDVTYQNLYGVTGIVTTLQGTDVTYTNAYVNTGVVTTLAGTNLTYSTADIDTAYVTTGIVTTLQGTDVTYQNLYGVTGVVTTIQGTDASYTNAYVNTGVVTALSVPSNGTLDVDGKTDLDDLNVAGVATFTAGSNGDTKIGFGNTALIVEGDARIIGVLTIGSSSLTLDGDNNIINVGSGVTIDGNTNVIQLGSDVTIDSGGLDVAGVSSITATTIFGDIDGELNAPGNTHYVATTGDDDHTGDNINQPYRTLAKALSVASDGDVIQIAAGDYAETCPLTVPAGVTVRGNGMRSVTVRPTDSTKTENVFLLNNLSTIEDITIKGSYYRSAGDTGYAFAYQPGIAITNRSPYIQRVTVLNRGSNVTADDPYGYDTADSPPTSYVAGRGAKVDGSLVDSESIEAGMLFNEVTFFTPNSKGIILTNGARAEYLNCFHYFASEAIVGESGSVGIASTAGSRLNVVGVTTTLSANDVVKQFDGGGNVVAIGTVKTFDSPYIVLTEKGSGIFTAIGAGSTNDVRFYDSDGTTQRGYADRVSFADYTMFGAELRSVGCAVEYGSKGVIADGDGVNMRLFALNFNHVGSGKDFSNDPTKAIQANETTELNNGEVSYVSIDHKGDFRVGESFYVNQETGSVSFAATSVNLEVTGNMDVTDGVDTSTLTPTSLSVGNLQLAANTFSSVAGDIVIDPANNSETRIQGDLSVIGILTASTISVDSLQTGDSSIAIDDTGSNGTIRFNTDGSEAFRVDSSQRIGIGTNNPDRTLTVEGDFDTYGQTQHYGDLRVTGVSTLPTLNGTELTYTTADIDNAYVTTGIVTTLAGSNLNYTQGVLDNGYVVTGVVTTIQGTDASYTNVYANVGVVTSLSIPANGTFDVDGKTDLDDLSVAGVATFSAPVGGGVTTLVVEGDQRITGILTVGTASVTINGTTTEVHVGSATTIHTGGYQIGNSDIHSSGATLEHSNVLGVSTVGVELSAGGVVTANTGGLNVTGVTTATAFHTGAEGSAIRVTSNTISGPATLNIDPAGVGDNTGTVVIKGDLQVDGTQTIVNSNTVTIDDKNIVLANGAANDAAADGGGITLESGDGNKTINWVDSTDAWTFSEHVNLASTKTYKIAGTDVLSADTLGSGVLNSSLTSVGTITTGTWQGTAIANTYLENSSISIGGVSLSLGDTDATPALDLQDATNYPYASLTGVTTSIVGDTTPQLGGNLDLNSSDITGTGDVNITGSVTASAAINSNTDVQINGTSVLTSASDEAVALAIALG